MYCEGVLSGRVGDVVVGALTRHVDAVWVKTLSKSVDAVKGGILSECGYCGEESLD